MMLAKSEYSLGDFHVQVWDSVTTSSVKLEIWYDNIAGVSIPLFWMRNIEDVKGSMNKIGLYGGATTVE